MATKSTTKSTTTNATVTALANVGLSEVVTAWDAADRADASIARTKGQAALVMLPIGSYLLALDATHGADKDPVKAATLANEKFREEMTADYEGRNKSFHWVKSRASKARNLARGVVALADKGVDASKDPQAVSALGTLASNVGAAGITDAVDQVAALVGEGKGIAEAVRSVMADVRKAQASTKEVSESEEPTVEEILTGALNVLRSSELWADSLTTAERATIKAIVGKMSNAASTLAKSL